MCPTVSELGQDALSCSSPKSWLHVAGSGWRKHLPNVDQSTSRPVFCCQMEAMHKVCSTTGLFYCACAFPGLSAGRGEKGYYTNIYIQIYIQIIYSFGFCLFASIPYDLTKIKTSVEKEGFHVQFMQIHVVVILIWRCKILAPVCPLTWNHKLIFSS